MASFCKTCNLIVFLPGNGGKVNEVRVGCCFASSPETHLLSLGSDTFPFPDLIIQIGDQVGDESLFRLGSKMSFLDLQDLSELLP